LDYDRSGLYPTLEVAKKAVWFYYTWIAKNEAHTGDLIAFPSPEQLDEAYAMEGETANAVYEAAS